MVEVFEENFGLDIYIGVFRFRLFFVVLGMDEGI